MVRQEDAPILGRYFEGLSEATRQRFGPHPFTVAEAQKLCAEIDYARLLRLIAVTGDSGQERVIAYFILTLPVRDSERNRYTAYGIGLEDGRDCTFAPSVADAYQDRGLGSALMPRILDLARRLGFRRMVLQGGTQAANLRGIHFYEKFGFRRVGSFQTKVDNHDMMLTL